MDGGRNWDWHNVVDVSPFLLYESTGDSEANSDLNIENLEVKSYEADDALSCCSDSYDTTSFGKYYSEERAQCSKKKSKKKEEYYARCLKKKSKNKEQACGYNPNYRVCDDDDEDEDDDGAINQVWSSCGKMGYVNVSRQQQKKNSKSNVMEPKEENDKLFWDTCLGS